MSLKIKKDLPTGATAEYWKIKNIVCDTYGGISVFCYGFLNQASKESEKLPIEHKEFHIDIDIKAYDKKLIDACYIELKKQEFFTGAEDV